MATKPKERSFRKQGRNPLPVGVTCFTRPRRNTPRQFTAQKLGDLICRFIADLDQRAEDPTHAVTAGAPVSREAIHAVIRKCVPCVDQEDADAEEAQVQEAVVESFIDTVNNNKATIAVAIAVLAALGLILPRLFGLLPAFLARIVPLGATVAVQQLPIVLTRLRAQQAANDAIVRTLQVIRRAA